MMQTSGSFTRVLDQILESVVIFLAQEKEEGVSATPHMLQVVVKFGDLPRQETAGFLRGAHDLVEASLKWRKLAASNLDPQRAAADITAWAASPANAKAWSILSSRHTVVAEQVHLRQDDSPEVQHILQKVAVELTSVTKTTQQAAEANFKACVADLETVVKGQMEWRTPITVTSSWDNVRQAAKPLFQTNFVNKLRDGFAAAVKAEQELAQTSRTPHQSYYGLALGSNFLCLVSLADSSDVLFSLLLTKLPDSWVALVSWLSLSQILGVIEGLAAFFLIVVQTGARVVSLVVIASLPPQTTVRGVCDL